MQEKIPHDLKKALSAHPKANEKWADLTPIARRDFVSWIESAKLAETRTKRIERTPDMLIKGKRRPCCYTIVPMNLYTALNKNPKAKATWKDLSSDERRDITDWIEKAKDRESKDERIEHAKTSLARGKRKIEM